MKEISGVFKWRLLLITQKDRIYFQPSAADTVTLLVWNYFYFMQC